MLRKLMVFAMLCISINALPQFSISGKITDENGASQYGANIQLKDTHKRTTSNTDGYFKLDGLKAGNYLIEISFLGFEKISEEIILDHNYEGNFKMTPASILGEEIIVRAIRAGNSSPVAYTNITQEELGTRNLGQDIPVLLSLTPSFVTTSDAGTGIGYTGFRVRGSDANRVNITVNGIPLNDAESHGVYWVNMPDFTSSVDNIQIQRGVGTSTHGSGAFGATVAMQTNTLEKNPYAEVSSSAGSFNTFKNTLKLGTGLIYDHFSFDARLSKITSDGYIDRGWSDLKSYFLSGGYYSDKTVIKVNMFTGIEHTYQAWNGLPSELLDTLRTYNSCGSYFDTLGIERFYNNETDNYQQDHYQLFFSHQFNKYFSLNAALHYTYGRGYYEEFKENSDMGLYGLSPVEINDTTIINTTDLIRQKWLDNDFYGFTLSANFKNNRNDITLGGGWNNYDGRHFGKVIWSQYMSNNMKDHEWYRGKGIKTDYNIFAKWDFQIVPGLNIYTDIQYRHISHEITGIDDDLKNLGQQHSFDFINPKAGINYTLNDNHEFCVFYAIANREPNRSNYTDADPDKTPRSERLFDLEAAYNYKNDLFNFGINGYFMNYKDQLILTGEINNVGSPIMTNVEKSYRTGVELSTSINIFENLQWQANTTFSRNKISDVIEYVDSYDTVWNWLGQISDTLGETDLAFSPGFIANSQLIYTPIKNFSISIISQYVGKQYIDNTSDEKRILFPYQITNLKFQYILKTEYFKEAVFHILINNIFDQKYENNAWVYSYYLGTKRQKDDGYYPQAGINFLAGITLRF